MIEQLARTSAEQLRVATTGDVEAGLAELYVRHARRQRRFRVEVVAAVVLAVGLAATGGAVLSHRAERRISPTDPEPSGNHAQPFCPTNVRVACLGHRTYRFPLVRPVDWHIPSDFGVGSGLTTPLTVESWRQTGRWEEGVTVLERARASSADGRRTGAGVTDTPQAFVHWVAARPFVSAGPVRTTTLDGHQAWQVRITMAPGRPAGPGICDDRVKCYRILSQPDGATAGVWGHQMVSEYTAFTLPGAGTTVIWSWMFDRHSDFSRLARVVDGLSWPDH